MRLTYFYLGIQSAALILVAGLAACAPQTDPKEKSAAASKSSETITAAGGTVSSASGSSISLPAGVVAIGTEVTAAETSAPSEFAVAEAEAASEALEVAAVGADGAPVLQAQQPMTISIVLDGAALALAEKSADNLCVLLKTPTSKLYIWRRADLAHDAAARKVSVESYYFGVFQVVYCGNETLPGFAAAKEQVRDAKGGSVTMTIPAGWNSGLGAKKACLAIFQSVKNDDGESPRIVASAEAVLTAAAADVTATGIVIAADSEEAVAMLHLQKDGTDCPYTVDMEWDSDTKTPDTLALYGWVLDADVLLAGQPVQGTIGEDGAFPTATIDVGIGAPGFAGAANLPNIPSTSACVDFDVQSGAKTMLPVSVSFASGSGFIAGAAVYRPTVAVPPNGNVDQHSLSLRVGDACTQFELGAQDAASGKPYEARFHAAELASSYYFAPTTLDINNGNAALAASNGCVRLYPYDKTPTQGGDPSSTWGNIMVALSGGSYPILVPYLQEASQHLNGKPTYDMVVDILSAGETCYEHGDGSGLGRVALPRRPLSPSITVEIN